MVERIEDLAIFGGTPAFSEPLHVGRPNIGNRGKLLARINDLLDRKWLTNKGVFVQELERRLAGFLGVKHCIVMCNGTVALEIAVRALGLKGEVIVPSFTFIATAHALQWQEITPVFCDISPGTYTIDPEKVRRLITPRTTGIIGVHVWGRPCEVDLLDDIAKERNLKVLYDAAHAFGCSRRGKMIGGFGCAEVHSFHATKFFNTFEGGAVTTDNDDLAAKIQLMKNFGFAGEDRVIYIGTNGKMSEVSAAMGLTQLEDLDSFIGINRDNYLSYGRHLAGLEGVGLISYDENEKTNYQYVVIEVDRKTSRISRDNLQTVLKAENVFARRYFFPGCHRMEPYRSYFPHAGLLLPVTEAVAERVLVLPTGSAVSPEDVAEVCRIIRLALNNGSAISDRLSSTSLASAEPEHSECDG